MSSVQEVCKILADLSQGVANTITENGQHVSKNEELKSIANLYFENTTKTLNLFNNFMHTDEFATQYESVYKDHVMLLEKIRELEVVLEKKHKHAKTSRRAAVGFLAALSLPAVAIVVVAASNPAFGMAGQAGEKSFEQMKKIYELTKKVENSKETLLGLSLLIGNRTEVNIEAMKTIKSVVEC